jgi:O-antigen/teichoic acid export membrane protein
VGGAWRPAVPLMRVLAFAIVFRAVVVLAGQLLDGVGRPALTMRVNAVRLGVLAALLPALALSGGLHGIPHAVLLANATAAVLAIRSSAIVLADPDVDLIAPRSTVDQRTEKTS